MMSRCRNVDPIDLDLVASKEDDRKDLVIHMRHLYEHELYQIHNKTNNQRKYLSLGQNDE